MMQVLQRFQKSDIMSTLDGYSETTFGKPEQVLIQNHFFLNIVTWVFSFHVLEHLFLPAVELPADKTPQKAILLEYFFTFTLFIL